jgi:lysophospholipase L1-like esterase
MMSGRPERATEMAPISRSGGLLAVERRIDQRVRHRQNHGATALHGISDSAKARRGRQRPVTVRHNAKRLRSTGRLSWIRGIALATFLATTGAAFASAVGAHAATPGTMHVLVMGDSYSAGNGAASYYGAPGCRRSHENYASQFTRAVAAAPYSQPADLNNVACSGALTSAFFSKTSGRPPEIDAVNHGYSLIFLTIGGNDLHFSDIVQYCLVAKTRDGANCGPNLARAQRLLDDGTMKQGLTHVLLAIHQAASSHAKIVLLGYPFLESGLQYTLRSGHGRHTFIAVGEKLHRVEADGNAVQQQVVKDLNASLHAHQFVFVDTEPLFAGTQPGFLGPNHELSATDVNPNRWFIQPFIDADRGPGTVDAITGKDVFYHPNLAGWTAEDKLLLQDPEVPKQNLIAPAPSASACAGRLDVQPGVGDITITLIQVRGVSCAEAKVAIARFEQDRRRGFHVNGHGFQCKSHTIGDPGNASYRTTCTRGTQQLVTWRSDAAI